MRGAACVALALIASFSGCAAQRPDREPVRAVESLAGEPGLEVRWWVVDDRGRAVGQSLRELERGPTPIDAATRERLRRAGLRVVTIDADALAALPAGWRTIGAVQEHHFRMSPGWAEIVKGTRLRAGSRADTGAEAVELGTGSLRLVARCWSEPGEHLGGAARTRIEVVPQHAPGSRGGAITLTPIGPTTFSALRASWSRAEPMAVLFVGEDPSVDWALLPEPAEAEPAGRGEAEGPDEPAEFWPPNEGAGPSPARVPTIGEAMLTTRPGEGRPGGLRVVVAVIVRPPERWSLLGR